MSISKFFLAVFLSGFMPSICLASALRDIAENLQLVRADWRSNKVLLWADGVENGSIALGGSFWLHAESEEPGFITYLYYDAEGSGTLMYGGAPHFSADGRYRYKFPVSGSLPVEEPPGRTTIIGFLSERKPDLSELGLSDSDVFLLLEDTALSVEELATALSSDPANRATSKAMRFFVEEEDAPPGLRARNLKRILLGPESSVLPLAKSIDMASMETDDFVGSGDQGAAGKENGMLLSIELARISGSAFDEFVHFETASSELTLNGRELLDVWSEILNSEDFDRRLILIGHTDDRGDQGRNQSLSESRAGSARNYLVGQRGVNPELVEAFGVGEDFPAVPNDGPEMWKKNRRVEFIFD